MDRKKVRWGIVGLGKISNDFTEDLMLVDSAVLQAVASRSSAKAENFARRFNAHSSYGSYQELFEDPEVDILYIGTPHDSHANLTIAALSHGKHVLCEKPIAVNKLQVQQMIEAARENGVFLMEALWSRFNPTIQQVYSDVQEGLLGEVNYVNADFCFYSDKPDDSRLFNPDLAGGALLDVGIYPIFLSYLIFGMPEKIETSARFYHTGVDLHTSAILTFKNGIANVAGSFGSHCEMTATICGTGGTIIINPRWHRAESYAFLKAGEKEATKAISHPLKGHGFTYEIEECNKCIFDGLKESPSWTLQNSLDLITILDQIREQIGLKYPFE